MDHCIRSSSPQICTNFTLLDHPCIDHVVIEPTRGYQNDILYEILRNFLLMSTKTPANRPVRASAPFFLLVNGPTLSCSNNPSPFLTSLTYLAWPCHYCPRGSPSVPRRRLIFRQLCLGSNQPVVRNCVRDKKDFGLSRPECRES